MDNIQESYNMVAITVNIRQRAKYMALFSIISTVALCWQSLLSATTRTSNSIASSSSVWHARKNEVVSVSTANVHKGSNRTLPVEIIGKWLEPTGAELVGPLVSNVNTSTCYVLEMEPLPFIKNFSNPCWIEKLADENPYQNLRHRFHMSNRHFRGQILFKQYKNRLLDGFPYRLRCLPSYFIIGPQKTGTTDLYDNLVKHPRILAGSMKEPHWWSRSRIFPDYKTTLTEYIDLFDVVADTIAQKAFSTKEDIEKYNYITGEATPELIWDNWWWRKQPEHVGRNLTEVNITTPHHIKAVLPHAKLIAIFRNPVDRLYSDYHYFGHTWKKNDLDFHTRVEKGIQWLNNCFKNASRKTCMYDPIGIGPFGSQWEPVVRIRMGLYSEFLEDWFQVFPKDQFKIVSLEDYSRNRSDILNQLFDFLAVGPVEQNLEKVYNSKKVSNARHHGDMLPKTRQLLEEFYRPFNEKLCHMTGTDSFDWNKKA